MAKTKKERYFSKPLHFPLIKRLTDLFDVIADYNDKNVTITPPRIKGGMMTLGAYCICDTRKGPQSLKVHPTAMLVQWAESALVTIENDETYFRLSEASDGVLVTIQYNRIIGDRWIAFIPRAEMWKHLKAVKQ